MCFCCLYMLHENSMSRVFVPLIFCGTNLLKMLCFIHLFCQFAELCKVEWPTAMCSKELSHVILALTVMDFSNISRRSINRRQPTVYTLYDDNQLHKLLLCCTVRQFHLIMMVLAPDALQIHVLCKTFFLRLSLLEKGEKNMHVNAYTIILIFTSWHGFCCKAILSVSAH